MRFYLVLIKLFLLCHIMAAQTQPPGKPDKQSTQKEMEDMMKQLQKEIDKMSPDEKKMM